MADLDTRSQRPESQAHPVTARRRPPRARRGARRGLQAAAVHLLAIVMSLICAGPVLLIVAASLHDSVFADFSLTPGELTLINYERLLGNEVFLRWMVNSLVVGLAVTAFTATVDVLAAYAFAKIRFAGREIGFRIMLITMMLPFSATLVPIYLLAADLGMVDRYSGLILPAAAAPFGVYLLRQFIQDIPDSLMEAARLDGAGHVSIFLRIVLPLCRQPLAVLAIFTFVANWNTFLWPLLVAQSEHMMTLPVGIATTNTQFVQNISLITAGAVISILPMAILFAAFQRQFIRGVLAGAVKS